MGEPIDKAELLKAIQAEHTNMEHLLSTLTPAQMTAPIFDAGWSVKDHLAHLVAWEKLMLGWLETSLQGVPPVRFTPEFVATEDSGEETMNRLNDHLYQVNKSRALDDVLADFRQTNTRVLATLSSLTDQDIFDPGRFPWRKGAAFYPTIEGNTFGHYQEHQGWIRAKFWVNGKTN